MQVKLPIDRKAIALGVLFTSAALLASCGSSSSSSNSDDEVVNGDTQGQELGAQGTEQQSEQQGTEQPVAVNSPSGDTPDLVGVWAICNIFSNGVGQQIEFEFKADSTYEFRIGVGDCTLFDTESTFTDEAGTYSIIGTTTSDSGLTAFILETTRTRFGDVSVPPEVRQMEQRLIFTGVEGQIIFSDVSSITQGEELNLELDFQLPAVRLR